MLPERTKYKTAVGRTILIILGVIVALVMTLNSKLFSAEEANLPKTNTKQSVVVLDEENTKENGITSSGLNSSARLFQIFTNNLPYLNSK